MKTEQTPDEPKVTEHERRPLKEGPRTTGAVAAAADRVLGPGLDVAAFQSSV